MTPATKEVSSTPSTPRQQKPAQRPAPAPVLPLQTEKSAPPARSPAPSSVPAAAPTSASAPAKPKPTPTPKPVAPVPAPVLSPLEKLKRNVGPFTTQAQGQTIITALPQLPGFLSLLRTETNAAHLLHLLPILRASSKEIHERFVGEQGLDMCQQWLGDKDPQVVGETLTFLAALPVTVAALKANGKIGKTVRRLSRLPEDSAGSIRSRAEHVVAAWKALIDATEKKRALPMKPEPPTKRARLSSSQAFKSQQAPRDANVLVVKKRPPKKASIPARPSPSLSPEYKRKAPDPAPMPTPAPVASPATALASRTRLASCLANPDNRKPKRNISWSTPLQHVKCFRKDKESKVSEDYLRTMRAARSSSKEREATTMAPSGKPVSAPPPPAPGLRVSSCPIVPTQEWYVPRSLALPELDGVSSREAKELEKRAKLYPRVFYPDRKHIPLSPPLLNSSVATPKGGRVNGESIPPIPLHPPPEPVVETHHAASVPPAPVTTTAYQPHSTARQVNAHNAYPHSYPSYSHSQPDHRSHDPSPSLSYSSLSSSVSDPYAQRTAASYSAPSYHENQNQSHRAPSSSSSPVDQMYTPEQYLTLKILLQKGSIQNFMGGNPCGEDAAQIRQLLDSMRQNGQNPINPPPHSGGGYPPRDRNSQHPPR